ncbi:GNAT family N-acetyltransferase [Parendozoicomonas sp. Alg238-R29]|uniref:GNAT family N-acetyltransferase n=1 Tax=Parendozoicomonas sp. Alg238-R29 TaxID=2993446 RepID=UPI00248F3C9D|nr:GNAT family N-acetyltransferase [Parendozoicomonas sp. Alg238-R29]
MNISVASQADKAGIIKTLVAAYYGDPIIRWMYPDYSVYLKAFAQYLEYILPLPLKNGLVYVAGEEGIDGVALWSSSGGKGQQQDVIQKLYKRYLLPDINISLQAISRRVRENCSRYGQFWYLQLFAVHPEQQGKGLGKTMLRQSIHRIQSNQQWPVLLYTNWDRTVSLYEQVGFRIIDQFQAGSSPQSYVMMYE